MLVAVQVFPDHGPWSVFAFPLFSELTIVSPHRTTFPSTTKYPKINPEKEEVEEKKIMDYKAITPKPIAIS
jgi:hypothetical protein